MIRISEGCDRWSQKHHHRGGWLVLSSLSTVPLASALYLFIVTAAVMYLYMHLRSSLRICVFIYMVCGCCCCGSGLANSSVGATRPAAHDLNRYFRVFFSALLYLALLWLVEPPPLKFIQPFYFYDYDLWLCSDFFIFLILTVYFLLISLYTVEWTQSFLHVSQ